MPERSNEYRTAEVEQRWQARWEADRLDRLDLDAVAAADKLYNLVEFPYPSAEGLHIGHAFTYGGAGSFQVFVADVASGQLIQLTSQGRNESPTWSPDSRHISFQSNRSGRWEVWQAHIDGSGQRALTRGGGRSPTWAK